MKIDNSWERYYNKKNSLNYKRYYYSISHLFGNVLDVGCGDGFGAYLMSQNKDIKSIVGIDIEQAAIDMAAKNYHSVVTHKEASFIVGEAEKLPFGDNSFDCVHCGQTLEHVNNDEECIGEIRRAVRSRVVFSVPIMGGISDQHIREYKNKDQIIHLIGKYFKVISIKEFIDEKNTKRIVIIADK